MIHRRAFLLTSLCAPLLALLPWHAPIERSGTYRVTNLNDAGPGSLRAAVAARPRQIIFDVAGTMALGSDITVA